MHEQIMNSTDIQLNSFCIFCEVAILAIRQKPDGCKNRSRPERPGRNRRETLPQP